MACGLSDFSSTTLSAPSWGRVAESERWPREVASLRTHPFGAVTGSTRSRTDVLYCRPGTTDQSKVTRSSAILKEDPLCDGEGVLVDLMFEAGRAATARGWSAPHLATVEDLTVQSPTGPPLVVVSPQPDLTVSMARAIAALSTAREVLLVTDEEPETSVLEWIPGQCLLVVGETPHVPVPDLADAREFESRRAKAVKMIDELSTSPDEVVRRKIASNPATPAEVLRRLAADPDEWVPSRVAENPKTPTDVLLAFAAGANRVVRSAVAENPAAPPNLLRDWSTPGHEDATRRTVACNPGTPADVIAALATDSDEGVRSMVAANFSAPDHLLRALAKDPVWNVRSMVAWNRSTPADLLDVLSSDPEFMVRESANESIASRPTTPVERLHAMFADDSGVSDSVRAVIGGNPNAPVELQWRVAAHDSPYMRVNVARNPGAAGEILLRLMNDVDKSVCGAAAGNPSLPLEGLVHCSKHRDRDIRSAVAENRSTPTETQLELLNDVDPLVRASAALAIMNASP